MSKKPATEILVHITAPSRSKDDAKYRALANTYHGFEPTTRTSVFSKTISPNVVANQAVARPQPVATGAIGPSTQPNQIIRSSGIAGFIETPMLSWRDAANNLASPSLRMRQDERRDEPSQNSQLSWQPPPSVVQDSLPDNDVTLSQFCTPTRLLEDYLHPSDSSQSFLLPSPVREKAPRAQPSTAGPVQTQYEGDSTFPTISHISQRRQVDGIESLAEPPQPNSSSRGNGADREADDEVRTAPLPRIITARELHVSAASGKHSSCGQLGKQRSRETAESSSKRSLRCKTPADPRNKIIPLSPAVNTNNKRRRPPSSSRESDFMIASSQPEPIPQDQVSPRANTIINNGEGRGPSNKPSLSSSSSSPPRTESEPSPTKRLRRTSPSLEPEPETASAPTTTAPSSSLPEAPSSSATQTPKSPSGKPPTRSLSDIGPRQDALKDAQLATRNARLWSLLELRPPMPETADLYFDLSSAEGKQIGEGSQGGPEPTQASLITSVLAKLAIDLKLDKRFRPSLQTRPLRPYERGYWLVDCTSWSRALKEECWSFLDEYLGSGVAGWGIWCTRDEEFTRMRMYCWGATVGHIYLLLYVISKREVKYTGAEWRDGEGEVVVRVNARSRDKGSRHKGG